MRYKNTAAFLLFLLSFFFLTSFLTSAHSTTITTVGSLSYDDDNNTNNIITDSLNDYDWLRWDALPNYDYTQTLAATSVGGEFEEWNIADINEAQKFVDALLGANACKTTDITFTVCYNSREKSFNDLLGDNFDSNGDKAWFLSGRDTGQTAGYIETYSDKAVYKFNTGSNFFDSDEYSSSGSYSNRSISWLLYRDSIPVNMTNAKSSTAISAPPTLMLFIFGLLCFAGFNYRRNTIAIR